LLAAAAAGCSAASLARPDASIDAALPDVGMSDGYFGDAGVCGPIDVPDYAPDVMHSPNPPHANKCTAQQAADYASCEGGNTANCAEFGAGQSAYTCGQCIESQKTDPTWGVVVFDMAVGTLNTEGCVDDALMQVPYEIADKGHGSCGDLLYASYGCQQASCNACMGSAFDTCTMEATSAQCLTFDQAVESPTGLCKALFDDAAPSAVASCFPDLTMTDAAMQRADWITRMAQYMCGP
jgi:hypothetical protein